MTIPTQPAINWLDPWRPLAPGEETLGEELQREVGPGHPLAGLPVVALARRSDNDDVLFGLTGAEMPLAVVHLTWSGRRERAPAWPATTFYAGWEDWIGRCMMPAHRGER